MDEVRKIKERHAGEFGFDLDAIYRDIKAAEKAGGKRYVTYEPQARRSRRFMPPARPGRHNSRDPELCFARSFRALASYFKMKYDFVSMMIGTRVDRTKRFERQLDRVPEYIRVKAMVWIAMVERSGIREVRRRPGFHDEPLRGRRSGQR